MKKEGNLILGIFGALLGGLIATIPWILVYVYGNMILSVLAIIIAAGALFGYKFFKGPINKGVPIIITIISLLCVVISTLILIPALLLLKEGVLVNIDNFTFIYQNSEFVAAITKDLFISIIFTFLGISGIIKNLKNQISDNKEVKIDLNNNQNIYREIGTRQSMKRQIEIVRPAFEKYNAFDKATAVSKEELLKEIDVDNSKQIFNSLKLAQIIKKKNNKYYFSEKYANSTFKRFIVLYAKVMLWIIAISAIFLIFVLFSL